MVGRRLSYFTFLIRSQIVNVAKELLPARGDSVCHRNKAKLCLQSCSVPRRSLWSAEATGQRGSVPCLWPPHPSDPAITASPSQPWAVVPCPLEGPPSTLLPLPTDLPLSHDVQSAVSVAGHSPGSGTREKSAAAGEGRALGGSWQGTAESLPSRDPGWGPAASAHAWSHPGASLGPAASPC